MINATEPTASVTPAGARERPGELARLRAENARLRSEIAELRAALDSHIARSSSTHLYGPVEMTAGTCVGPRRGRHKP